MEILSFTEILNNAKSKNLDSLSKRLYAPWFLSYYFLQLEVNEEEIKLIASLDDGWNYFNNIISSNELQKCSIKKI